MTSQVIDLLRVGADDRLRFIQHKESEMTNPSASPLLRRALLADAVASGLSGALLLLDANALGWAYGVAQAAVVGMLAEAQFIGLRRAGGALRPA